MAEKDTDDIWDDTIETMRALSYSAPEPPPQRRDRRDRKRRKPGEYLEDVFEAILERFPSIDKWE